MQTLWIRRDEIGHDAATVIETQTGWRLMGNAAFRQDGRAAGLAYVVDMTADGVAQWGRVRGFLDETIVDQTFQRTDDDWMLNGRPQGLSKLVDLDFGFTPATNWQQLKRLALKVGERAEVNVAWWDVGAVRLQPLPQTYERTGENTYLFEAPTFDYRATLTIAPSGFVVDYPGLWAMESFTDPDAETG